jgi:hypothetical protein
VLMELYLTVLLVLGVVSALVVGARRAFIGFWLLMVGLGVWLATAGGVSVPDVFWGLLTAIMYVGIPLGLGMLAGASVTWRLRRVGRLPNPE